MGEIIEFASNGGTANGYLAEPAVGTGVPLVVIQEWWGLVPHIQDVCDRFAAEGLPRAGARPLPRRDAPPSPTRPAS